MKSGTDLGKVKDELEEKLLELIGDQAVVTSALRGSGQTATPRSLHAEYFQEHHPEAAALIAKMGGAVGFKAKIFEINVLRYDFLYIVSAEDFDDHFFDSNERALQFARNNYEPWIINYQKSSNSIDN